MHGVPITTLRDNRTPLASRRTTSQPPDPLSSTAFENPVRLVGDRLTLSAAYLNPNSATRYLLPDVNIVSASCRSTDKDLGPRCCCLRAQRAAQRGAPATGRA